MLRIVCPTQALECTRSTAPPFSNQTHSVGLWFEEKRKLPPKRKPTQSSRFFLFGGSGWIRTTEGIASRFTVCPLWPLGNAPISIFTWNFDIIPNEKYFVNTYFSIFLKKGHIPPLFLFSLHHSTISSTSMGVFTMYFAPKSRR